MGETIALTWWHSLLMFAGAMAILYVLISVILEAMGTISDKIDEWTGKKKKRVDAFKGIQLNLLRKQLFDMSQEYDDRHGIRYGSEGSAFNWFFKKYSYEELEAMDSSMYFVSELFTDEEFAKLIL